jgi:hypothetical protein
MKRSDMVTKLLKEGFSSNTLSKFSDKQIVILSNKILKEAETTTVQKTTYDANNPKDKEALNQALSNPDSLKGKEVEVKEEKKSTRPIATKNEIMELVSEKLKTHKYSSTKLPEFMTYDSIKSGEVQTKPATKPATPTTKPGQRPGEKPYNPYQPGPGTNPSPKGGKIKNGKK